MHGGCTRSALSFTSCCALVLLLFSSCSYPFFPPARMTRWPRSTQTRAGTRAPVSGICPRHSHPSTCCQERMKLRVLAGGTPYFLMYRRVMSLTCSTGAGVSPRKPSPSLQGLGLGGKLSPPLKSELEAAPRQLFVPPFGIYLSSITTDIPHLWLVIIRHRHIRPLVHVWRWQ